MRKFGRLMAFVMTLCIPFGAYADVYGEIQEDRTRIKKSPSKYSDTNAFGYAGEVVSILGYTNGWYEVEDLGYIPEKYVATSSSIIDNESTLTILKPVYFINADNDTRVIEKGSEVAIIGRDDEKFIVDFDNELGYVYADDNEADINRPQDVAPYNVIDYAMQFLGNPYVYGGTSLTEGIDCSAYVQAVYAQFGYTLPRTTFEQFNQLPYEVDVDDLEMGDLIYYGSSPTDTDHVVLYIGEDLYVHASSPEYGIRIDRDIHHQPILGARRVIY